MLVNYVCGMGVECLSAKKEIASMNCVIIDDDPIARATLTHLAKQIDGLEIRAEFSCAIDAYNFLVSEQVDLLFLDVEMPGMSGIELAKSLSGKCPSIIFTTSKREHATEAFELSAADYLVKPVRQGRFIQAVDKAREIVHGRKLSGIQSQDNFLFIRDANGVRSLKMEDILYAEAMGDYVKIFTKEKLYAVHCKLKNLETRLPEERFLRVHRSYIVSIDKIEIMQEGTVLIASKFVPIANTYKKTLSQRMRVL